MSVVAYKPKAHPQQQRARGYNDSVNDRALPQEVFDQLHARFNFSIDAAAAPHNAKLPRFYSIENCGLSADWTGERVYCNPPYSDIEPWVVKASESTGAQLVVMLLPANRTEQGWWQRHVEPFRDRGIGGGLRTEFWSGRQRFIAKGKSSIGKNERPPFGCVLLIWDRSEPKRVDK
jgi:phage N-6-adenine-methyltransferase